MEDYSCERWPITRASFNLTRACNLACSYCFTNGCRPGDMSEDIGKRAIDFLFKNAARATDRLERQVEVSFWGGEPLLKWELLKTLAVYAKDVSKRTAIPVNFGGTTNGILLTPEKFDFLDEIGCKFMVSLDGTPETHNFYRKFRGTGWGSHEVTKINFQAALRRWKDYRPRMGLIAERVDHFYEDMKYLFDLGADYLTFSPVYEGPWTDEKWAIWEEQAKRVIDYMVELKAQGRNPQVHHFDGYRSKDNSQYPCGAGRFYVGIDIDGAIYPCHRFNKFDDNRSWQEKETCIGHVDHGITRPEFRKYFIEWKANCGDCARLNDTPCHGGCYASRWDFMGTFETIPNVVCKYVEAQKRVSDYYKEKFPMEEHRNAQSCICHNMCYSEGTENEIRMPDQASTETCVCNNTTYDGPLDAQARPLTFDERQRRSVAGIPPAERAAIGAIFKDIDVRLRKIEEKLGIERWKNNG